LRAFLLISVHYYLDAVVEEIVSHRFDRKNFNPTLNAKMRDFAKYVHEPWTTQDFSHVQLKPSARIARDKYKKINKAVGHSFLG